MNLRTRIDRADARIPPRRTGPGGPDEELVRLCLTTGRRHFRHVLAPLWNAEADAIVAEAERRGLEEDPCGFEEYGRRRINALFSIYGVAGMAEAEQTIENHAEFREELEAHAAAVFGPDWEARPWHRD